MTPKTPDYDDNNSMNGHMNILGVSFLKYTFFVINDLNFISLDIFFCTNKHPKTWPRTCVLHNSTYHTIVDDWTSTHALGLSVIVRPHLGSVNKQIYISDFHSPSYLFTFCFTCQHCRIHFKKRQDTSTHHYTWTTIHTDHCRYPPRLLTAHYPLYYCLLPSIYCPPPSTYLFKINRTLRFAYKFIT